MTELEQFAADPNATPPRVALSHLQNQLLDLGTQTRPTRATPPTERRPRPPHQLVMPTENRLRLDKHRDESRTVTRWLSAAMIVRSAIFNCGLST